MAQITLLNQETIDKIAAGEVVEMRTGKNASDEELAAELKISEEELCSWQSQLKVPFVIIVYVCPL